MQRLQISLKNGQTLVVDNESSAKTATPEFARFLDDFRLSGSRDTGIFRFMDPVLMVRLSEVAAASVLFIQPEEVQTTGVAEVKRRVPRKISAKDIT